MPKIKKLSDEVVSKIAAGEVVEGPASVVKELVENSIDANAKTIIISVYNGGLKEISVSDDGIGMSKDDLAESYKRHTTSKLRTVSDLENISQLGFRGEALASIAAVSEVQIATREKKSIEGVYVNLTEGKTVTTGIIGMPVGTKVTVANLFYNVPARKKFLRGQATELKYITDIVSRICLSHIAISFKVFHNGKLLLDVPVDRNYQTRVRTLFTDSVFKNMIPVNFTDTHFSIHGFVSRPQLARASKAKQYLYVNNRFITDSLVSNAVRDAYKTLIDMRKNPPFVLFLTVPPKLTDVNVHPQKLKMRFLNKEEILAFIKKAVELSLQSNDITFIKQGYEKLNLYMGTALSADVSAKLPVAGEQSLETSILQVHDLYLIKQSIKGVIIVDQHAAHERILYDKLVKLFAENNLTTPLDIPVEINLDVSDSILLEEYLPVFEKIGFKIRKLTANSYEVSSVPFLLQDRNIAELIKEVLDDIELFGMTKKADTNSMRALSYLACRSAIKDGVELTSSQREWLFEQLEKTDIQYTCPHGRPAKVEIPLSELNHWFNRA